MPKRLLVPERTSMPERMQKLSLSTFGQVKRFYLIIFLLLFSFLFTSCSPSNQAKDKMLGDWVLKDARNDYWASEQGKHFDQTRDQFLLRVQKDDTLYMQQVFLTQKSESKQPFQFGDGKLIWEDTDGNRYIAERNEEELRVVVNDETNYAMLLKKASAKDIAAFEEYQPEASEYEPPYRREIFDDSKLTIAFVGAEDKQLFFEIENTSSEYIRVQADAFSVNGYSHEVQAMSKEFAPKSKRIVIATLEKAIVPVEEEVKCIGGEFIVLSMDEKFEQYFASFEPTAVDEKLTKEELEKLPDLTAYESFDKLVDDEKISVYYEGSDESGPIFHIYNKMDNNLNFQFNLLDKEGKAIKGKVQTMHLASKGLLTYQMELSDDDKARWVEDSIDVELSIINFRDLYQSYPVKVRLLTKD